MFDAVTPLCKSCIRNLIYVIKDSDGSMRESSKYNQNSIMVEEKAFDLD